MSFEPSKELKQVFHLASLRSFARQNLKGDEWQAVSTLMDRMKRERAAEEKDYRANYDTRVETARRALIDKAGAKSNEFKPPQFGVDRFDENAIERQAHRMVHAEHSARMAGLDQLETSELERLTQPAHKRMAEQQDVRVQFQRSSDRRVLPSRRRQRTMS
ncbi:MAG: hypothetical protein AAF903_09155 [Pseudomonadota bacterium]